jgi:hypothetical protein
MKLLKIIGLAGLIFSDFALATERPLNANELELYKTAVWEAFNQQNFICHHVKGFEMQYKTQFTYAMQAANSGTIDTEGTQPLLVLTFFGETASGKPIKRSAQISTSSDYRTISSIRVQNYETQTVNLEGLRHPKYQDQLVIVHDSTCAAKP